ncbi:MAG: C10 family peptidase, partial [Bacteroidales bacterium]|nr:C10 family peptidase [Bacteroidales bacterium]
MKRFLLLWVFISMVLVAFAQGQASRNNANEQAQREPSTHVTAAQAMDVGCAFMHTGCGSKSGGTQSSAVSKQSMQLIYTGKATDSLTRGTTDCYYVFALQPKGFVIVAADNRVEPILGYSYDNNFVVENMPEHVRGWLGDYEKQIQLVTKSDQQAEPDIKTKWSRLKSGQHLSNIRNGITVGPLLTTTWDQVSYYNALCPEDPNGPGGHALAGCVATAMAQIINYWGYPVHGRGAHSYSSNYGTLTVNYDSTYYDYANMPDALTSTSTQEEINAVAKLMYHCGVAVNMEYGTGGSGALNADARAAFVDQFRYSPQMGFADRELYGNTEWIAMIQNEINNGRPVFYVGEDDNVGLHAFVCDGYDENNYFHFNFGWSGNGDGWYLISNINPGINNFQSRQTAIMGIEPDSLSNTLYSLVGLMSGGYTQYVIDSSFFFCNELYDNPYRTMSVIDANVNMVSFYPADTTKQLVLDYMLFSESPSDFGENSQYVYIFDGMPVSYIRSDGFIDYILPDSLMRQYVERGNNLDHSPVVSTKHGLTLVIRNRYLSDQDFHFRISYDDGCRLVTDIATSVDTNTINLHWHEHGTANQWQVEYGTKGFLHGEGILLTINDANASLADLVSFREYDIYVRPLCDTVGDDSWSEVVTVMPEACYWTDVVTSQPVGYEEDSLGNVYISTAEGLAWLAKQSPNFWGCFMQGRKVVLTSDINLGRFKWSPIRMFSGVFDGQGHRIDSMYSNSGLLEICHCSENVTIKNIYLTNCYSLESGLVSGGFYAYDETSQQTVLRGYIPEGMDTIMNCFVSGRIKGEYGVAPIIHNGIYVYIINCATNCEINGGASMVGGIVDDGLNGGGHVVIRNSYSATSIYSSARWKGYVIGYAEESSVENCYGYVRRNGRLPIAYASYSELRDNTWFNETDSGFYLAESIYFEPDNQYYNNLTEALNAGVRKFNMEGLRLWVDDTSGINEGMPILGPEYVVTCPNIQNLAARNVARSDGEYGMEISWREMGEATTWEIEYHVKDSTNTVRVITTNYPDTIWGLIEQNTYVFRVRPICSSFNYGGWSDEYSQVFDRPYWTDIVTSQPEGYNMDADGNVSISSAEGLAWLSSVVNGLNGQSANNFEGKRVVLIQDIRIGLYKWKAINNFLGTFDGNGHTISGLYINELTKYQGLFGIIYGGVYINALLDSVNVKGKEAVGGLIGGARDITIINCQVIGKVYGEFTVGGMIGWVNNSPTQINSCSSSGIVQSKHDIVGGLIGNISGGIYINGSLVLPSIRNSYSRCDVIGNGYASGGLIGSGQYIMENCYATGDVTGRYYNGGVAGSINASILRNCYAAGIVNDKISSWVNWDHYGYRFGSVVGTTVFSPFISNCYGLADPIIHTDGTIAYIMVGESDDDNYPIVSNLSPFTVMNDSVILIDSVTVGQLYYNNLLDALNAWVDTYDTAGVFLHWEADTANVNGGFPVFATSPCPVFNVHYTVVACDNYTWNGETYTTSGTYYYIHVNANGFTQVDTLHLTINTPLHTAITETSCESYTWHNTTYTESGTYTYTHEDVNGCTQVDTLHLTIYKPEHITITETCCESYIGNYATYTESGTYTYAHEDANGCIQVDTLHLTICKPVHIAITETSCESYIWHNTAYNESGTYTYAHEDANGCTQVDTLHLTIHKPVHIAITETSCESYIWHNTAYNESGTYTYTHEDANGCTQVDTLHLTINEDVVSDFTITTSDSCYIWNGQTYCASGDYTQSFETVDGCDSVASLHLTITVGIGNYDLANVMKLYPNPTKDVVNVQLTMNNEQLEGVSIQL